MKKVGFLKRAAASSLALLLAVGGIPSQVLATDSDGTTSLPFEIREEIIGDIDAVPGKGADFSFLMEGKVVNGSASEAPLPEQNPLTIAFEDSDELKPVEVALSATDGESEEKVQKALLGTIDFEIDYTQPGVYEYTISQSDKNFPEGYTYDDTVYNITVTVGYDRNGNLIATCKQVRDGADEKSASTTFINEYVAPQSESTQQSESTSQSETTRQSEPVTEKQSELATETQTELETESELESETEIETETELQTETTPTTEPTTEAPNPEKPTVSMNFDKLAADTGAELSGAVLRVIDAKGVTVEQWTSDGSIHTISGKLYEGESYRLIEVSAPDGYQFAADVQFTAAQDVTVVMSDEAKPKDKKQDASVSVTKQLTCYGDIIGAMDQVFYVALYEDPACTHRISEIKSLEFKMASSVTVAFNGLEAGKTYYLGEADVNGISLVSGQVDDGTIFTTDFIQGQAVTAAAQSGASSIKFLNEFYEIPHNFYREGELVITKKLLNADGNAQGSNETFYAGIFADPKYTTLSDGVSSNIVALQMNGASEASQTVAVVLSETAATNLYVTEVDANGIPVAEGAGFAYEVTVNGSAVSLDAQNTGATVTITNQMKPEEVEETQETEKTTEAATTKTGTNSGSTSSSVKTGDETPIEFYIALLVAAVVVLLVVEVRRRRRNA
jgi:pilin isopeptide linkage protein